MADRLKRGSAPGRARSEDQRPGSFKKGHKKRGGRQRGTPNKFSAEYKKDILEAANRIGDGCKRHVGRSRLSPVGCGTLPADFRWHARQRDGVARARDRTATEGAPDRGGVRSSGKGAYWVRRPRRNYSQNPRSPSAARSDRRKDCAQANGTRSDPSTRKRTKSKGRRRKRTNPLSPIYPGRGPAGTTPSAS